MRCVPSIIIILLSSSQRQQCHPADDEADRYYLGYDNTAAEMFVECRREEKAQHQGIYENDFA